MFVGKSSEKIPLKTTVFDLRQKKKIKTAGFFFFLVNKPVQCVFRLIDCK